MLLFGQKFDQPSEQPAFEYLHSAGQWSCQKPSPSSEDPDPPRRSRMESPWCGSWRCWWWRAWCTGSVHPAGSPDCYSSHSGCSALVTELFPLANSWGCWLKGPGLSETLIYRWHPGSRLTCFCTRWGFGGSLAAGYPRGSLSNLDTGLSLGNSIVWVNKSQREVPHLRIFSHPLPNLVKPVHVSFPPMLFLFLAISACHPYRRTIRTAVGHSGAGRNLHLFAWKLLGGTRNKKIKNQLPVEKSYCARSVASPPNYRSGSSGLIRQFPWLCCAFTSPLTGLLWPSLSKQWLLRVYNVL